MATKTPATCAPRQHVARVEEAAIWPKRKQRARFCGRKRKCCRVLSWPHEEMACASASPYQFSVNHWHIEPRNGLPETQISDRYFHVAKRLWPQPRSLLGSSDKISVGGRPRI